MFFPFVFIYLLCAIGFSIAPLVMKKPESRLPRWALALAGSPVIITALLFYSVAFHMHQELDGWPASLRDTDFSPQLDTHLYFAELAFSGLVLFCLFGYPLTCIAGVYVPNRRQLISAISVFSFSSLTFYLSFFFMPSKFMIWWID